MIDDDGDLFGMPPQDPEQLPLFDMPDQDQQTLDNAAHAHQQVALLNELRQGNVNRYQSLLALSRAPDPAGILMTRINTLVALLLTDAGRVNYEIAFETEMAEFLEACLSQARQMTLVNPAPMPTVNPQGLIRP